MIAKQVQTKALGKYVIWLKYDDGTAGKINLSHLAGQGIFKQWDKNNFFEKVYIDKQSNSIAWSDVIQLCPNTLYLKLKKTFSNEKTHSHISH